MIDDSADQDADQGLIAEVLGEIEAGRMTLESAAAAHPALGARLRDMDAMRRVLWTAQEESEPPRPATIDEFQILGVVGRGGMGVVYRARHPRLDRDVAIKTIKPTHVSESARRRFLREQTALARLHQTNIVPIYASGCDGAIEYFVMPYIEGASLHDILQTARKATSTGQDTRTLSALAKAARSLAHDKQESTNGALATASWTPAATAAPFPKNAVSTKASTPAVGPEYVRSVVEAVAAAAEALAHAHRKGVIHRDLKPQNIMVAEQGHVWIIDLGLAGLLGRDEETATKGEDVTSSSDAEPLTRAAVGTWSYMAPEQFQRKADRRTDVWGLGVTIYELLTLQRAFPQRSFQEAQCAIESADPSRPSTVVPTIPRDLEAICLKAIAKSPESRYQSGSELADDLRRWLRGDAVSARPQPLYERGWRWGKRNPGWATALVAALVGATTFAFEAEKRARIDRRARSLQTVQTAAQSDQRLGGWFASAWQSARSAAREGADRDLQAAAATILGGLDGHIAKSFQEDASSVAFHRDGRRVLFGGTPKSAAKIWDEAAGETKISTRMGAGPVAFGSDDAALQLLDEPDGALVLWDVAKNQSVRRFSYGQVGTKAAAMVLSDDASKVAAAVADSEKQATIIAWDVATDKEVGRWPMSQRPTALVFSPDNAQLAAGGFGGLLIAWSLADGKPVFEIGDGRLTINDLTFGRDVARRDGDLGPAPWLLAAADGGGSVTVWDMGLRRPRCRCRGTDIDSSAALRFSPDGVTLASGGRSFVHLWDVATGRKLLALPSGDQILGIDFSADGRRLATAAKKLFGRHGGAKVYDLEAGRGVGTLRGLEGMIDLLAATPDGGRIAALTRGWQVAAWDRATGNLYGVVDVPQGYFTTGSALALSPDGRRLAFMGGKRALLWELPSFRKIGDWPLPPGHGDCLMFHPTGMLLAVRQEAKDESFPPFGPDSNGLHPRVLRVRNLLAAEWKKPIANITKYNLFTHVFGVSPDGARVVVEGLSGTIADRQHSISVFDGLTGKELFPIPVPPIDAGREGSPFLILEPAHKFFVTAQRTQGDSIYFAYSAAEGRPLGQLGPWYHGRSAPGLMYSLADGPKLPTGLCQGFTYFAKDRREPLALLGIDQPSIATYSFTLDGRLVIRGNSDGSVNVFDLAEIQRRLAGIGLGW